MNILEEIVAQKKKEVELKKIQQPINKLIENKNLQRQSVSLAQALLAENSTGIIAEFKRKSPSKGWINQQAQLSEITKAYEANGAAGMSVLTDEMFFGGELTELQSVRNEVEIPLLRKDFMVDEYQLYEAKAYGADVILLIAACLSKQQTKLLASKAKQLQLEVLLEIHSVEETDHICDEVDIIGINNRNLETFITDIQTSIDLLNHLPKNKPLISESGISNIETILQLRAHGYKGFLIGEHFMKQPKPALAFADFMQSLKAKLNEN